MKSQQRHDIYTEVHKGLRREICAWVGRLGQLDASNQQVVQESRSFFGQLADLLRDHAHHEDKWVNPMLETCDAELARRLEQEHQEIEEDLSRLETLFDKIVSMGSGDCWSIQQELYRAYAEFCSRYLHHMAEEENVVMKVLHDHFDDQRLQELTNGIRESLPPEKMGAYLSIMIPAMHVEERVAMFTDMKAHAPAEAYEGVRQLAKSVLPQADWAVIENRL